MTDPHKTFHSFRHTFRDALRMADMPTEKANIICGWRESQGLAAHYGDGYPVAMLADVVNSVAYPGLNLKELWGK
jgi:integrase